MAIATYTFFFISFAILSLFAMLRLVELVKQKLEFLEPCFRPCRSDVPFASDAGLALSVPMDVGARARLRDGGFFGVFGAQKIEHGVESRAVLRNVPGLTKRHTKDRSPVVFELARRHRVLGVVTGVVDARGDLVDEELAIAGFEKLDPEAADEMPVTRAIFFTCVLA